MSRLEYNRKILKELSDLLEKNPNLRFGQALVITEVIQLTKTDKGLLALDPFSEESKTTFNRMKEI